MDSVLPATAPDEPDFYAGIGARLGEAHLERRLRTQQELEAHMAIQGRGIFRLERYVQMESVITLAFKLTGLYGRGHRNFLSIRLVENRVVLPKLPAAFEGLRLLHLADLHTDLDPALPEAVIAALGGIEYDLCVNTGDYRNRTRDCHRASMRQTALIYRHLRGEKFGVLGNHDFIEKVPDLEAMGMRILLNETIPLTRGGQTLWLQLTLTDGHRWLLVCKSEPVLCPPTKTVLTRKYQQVCCWQWLNGATLRYWLQPS